MYVWTGPWALVHEPTPLLRKLTGEFADRIARLWPAPHGAFLIANSARRHLVCLALLRGERAADDLELVLSGPIKAAIRAYVPNAPDGLARALERMGEEAWSKVAYTGLLSVLADPHRAKILHHARDLTPDTVAGVANLPTAIARAGGGRFKLVEGQSRVLREAYEAIERRVGAAEAEVVAARWARAGSAKQLFDWAAEDIVADIPAPPFPTPAGMRLLSRKADFREAAIRFRNCLRTYIATASSGESVFFEWLGQTPAIVQVSRDPVCGWRLCEVRARENDSVPEAERPAIVAAVEAVGVRVGPGHWSLSHALEQAGRGNVWPVSPEDRLNEAFGD